MFLYKTSSGSIDNYFNYKIQSKFLSGEKEQNHLKHVHCFFFYSFLTSDFSSDNIFLLCQLCNNRFDQRSKIILNPFSGIQFFEKAIFCYKIIVQSTPT